MQGLVDSAAQLAGLQEILTGMKVEFILDPLLVRGLDYYSRSVFEWITESLGAQGTICAGGSLATLIPPSVIMIILVILVRLPR